MNIPGHHRLGGVLAVLHRYQWWISGVLATAMVFWVGASDSETTWRTWLVFVLTLTLLWIPLAIRIGRSIPRSVAAFKAGLNETP